MAGQGNPAGAGSGPDNSAVSSIAFSDYHHENYGTFHSGVLERSPTLGVSLLNTGYTGEQRSSTIEDLPIPPVPDAPRHFVPKFKDRVPDSGDVPKEGDIAFMERWQDFAHRFIRAQTALDEKTEKIDEMLTLWFTTPGCDLSQYQDVAEEKLDFDGVGEAIAIVMAEGVSPKIQGKPYHVPKRHWKDIEKALRTTYDLKNHQIEQFLIRKNILK